MANLEDLKELAKGINRNKVKNIYIVGNTKHSNTIFDEFYHLLLDGKLKDDKEYAEYFYKNPINSKAYYKLKDRLFDRLINLVFFVDKKNKKLVPIQESYYECYKNAVAVKLLLGKSIRSPAIWLAKKTLKKCIFFGFSDIVIELARHLKVHYSNFDYNENNYELYAKLINLHLKIYKTEIKVEDYLQQLFIHHKNQVILNEELSYIFKKQKKYIQKVLKNSKSYKTTLNGFLYLLTYYELSGNWIKLQKTCNQIIEKGEMNKQYLSPNLIGLSYYRKLISVFFLGNYSETYSLVNKCFEYFQVGSFVLFPNRATKK